MKSGVSIILLYIHVHINHFHCVPFKVWGKKIYQQYGVYVDINSMDMIVPFCCKILKKLE